jgi:hypothetical protein
MDFAAGAKEWLAANPDLASLFNVQYNSYISDLLTGIGNTQTQTIALSIRDNKVKAIIGDASAADQEALTGVLYISNLIMDLQAWAYDGSRTTQYNQGFFVYSQWSTDLSFSTSRMTEVLWGQFQAERQSVASKRMPLNQYAMSGFHSVVALVAGFTSANSLDNIKVARSLAAFKRNAPLRSTPDMPINTPDQQLYFSDGQAVFTPLLQQFSCRSVAAVGAPIQPAAAINGVAPEPFVTGDCYPKRNVVIQYENVGEFRLPDRSDVTLSSSSATVALPSFIAMLVVAVVCVASSL